MDRTFWIFYICAVICCLSRTVEMCTKPTECDTEQPLIRPFEPVHSTWLPPGPINLICNVFGGNVLDKIIWIRNNSNGDSKILNSSSPAEKKLSMWTAILTDSPPIDKFPYTYQCVAIGKCCVQLISGPTPVNLPQSTTAPPTTLAAVTQPDPISLISDDIFSHTKSYTGFGKVHVRCRGRADNTTIVHWLRTDKFGKNTTLNTTELVLEHLPTWEASLLDRPNVSMFPYDYRCVLKTKCCSTKISKKITITYRPPFGDCPFEFFGSWKPIKVNAIPRKRSVKFTWTYDPDPEDTGFFFDFRGKKILNITAREYFVHGLVPNKKYEFRYRILFGKCKTMSHLVGFKTLPDIPSKPQNVTVTEKKHNKLNVSWSPPQYANGEWRHYIVSWKRSDTNDAYKQINVTSSPFILKNLDGLTSYAIIVQGVNHVGIGNSSEPVFAITKQDPNKYIKILNITSDPSLYQGFGRINVSCNGAGDNFTTVDWIRYDKDGNNVTLYTTSLKLERYLWQAESLDRPDMAKFPYTYKCVVRNKCCLTKISSPVTINYSRPRIGDGCPRDPQSIVKPIDTTATPGKRSVNFTWIYDADPEDTGFSFEVVGASPARRLNITAREYVVRDLDPNKKYIYLYNILYWKGCNISLLNDFTTLPDYPSIPRRVTVVVDGNSLNVSWLPPEYPNGEMKYYILSWKKSGKAKYMKRNVSSSHFVIEGLDYLTSYSIKLQAVNNLGIGESSQPVTAKTHPIISIPTLSSTPNTFHSSPSPFPKTGDESSNAGAVAGGVIGAILFVIIVVILLLLLRKRILKKQHNKSVREFQSRHLKRTDNPNNMDFLPLEQPPPELEARPLPKKADPPEDLSYIVLLEDWEIAPDNLKLLDKKLGGGQFGIVKQGLLTKGKDDPEIVAVKTLKDSSNEAALSDLKTELIILKEVNKIPHPNVIKLIGGCSIDGKLHVVTEFCSGGSLRQLLLNSRVYPSTENSSNYINQESTLNHRQLLKIATDISSGMIHLSSQKFVHRDLAARNILIGEDDMAKVSDFGLARDVGGAEEYIRNNQNLLPVKWMALESLLDGRFTTASDVWSYGVLLYEITTLGDEPYKNISPYNIVSHVGSGCRMSKPPQCSDEIYEIMQNCWRVEPAERPTFEEIRHFLQDMLIDNEKSYINLVQVVDEGSLSKETEPKNVSIKDGSVRYTTA